METLRNSKYTNTNIISAHANFY